MTGPYRSIPVIVPASANPTAPSAFCHACHFKRALLAQIRNKSKNSNTWKKKKPLISSNKVRKEFI
jgi:hypothetical protein